MREHLKHYREHAATLVLVVVAINIVAAVGQVVVRSLHGPVTTAMLSQSWGFMGLASVILVALAAFACCLSDPPTKHARAIGLASAMLVTIGVVLQAVFLLVGLFASATLFASFLEAIGGITEVVLKGGVAYLLWHLVGRSPRPVTAGTLDQPVALPGAVTTAAEQAVGARWDSAQAAAQGAQATWGGGSGTWNPKAAPTQPAALEPAPTPQRGAVVVSGDPAALEGPAAKASSDLWKR